jgi:hypothetical protein
MSTKPCCNDMKAYRVDFWPRILPTNPVTDWIQVREDHGLSIQVDLSQADWADRDKSQGDFYVYV